MPEHPDTLIWVAGAKPALEEFLLGGVISNKMPQLTSILQAF